LGCIIIFFFSFDRFFRFGEFNGCMVFKKEIKGTQRIDQSEIFLTTSRKDDFMRTLGKQDKVTIVNLY
jgi:hypothetical protein